ncbi:MAG: 16S rRNA (uracil(1498)-N(3))-methyltransferase [Clostridiales bacterium]|nr:16S rRNA (uracil(1498)-N(3))-methyltransferase [Clostridiales bacterium]
MRRFFVEKINETVFLRGEEHKHLSLVLRARAGERVVLFCGDGLDYTARIDSVGQNETRLAVIEKSSNTAEPPINLTLFFSALKGDKNDLVVQKATELGVGGLRPFISEFTQVKKESLKTDRLNKIALEAAKQCGRSSVPRVYPPLDFDGLLDALKGGGYDSVIFAYENAESGGLSIDADSKNIAVIVGGEGGFCGREAKAIADAGAKTVTLGKRILRAETASIALCALVMHGAGGLK